MRIVQHCLTYIALTDDRRNARQRHIQTSRLRKLRREQSELHLACTARFRMKTTARIGAGARMSFEVEL